MLVSVILAIPSIKFLESFLGFGFHVALKRTNDFGLGSAAPLPNFFELACFYDRALGFGVASQREVLHNSSIFLAVPRFVAR